MTIKNFPVIGGPIVRKYKRENVKPSNGPRHRIGYLSIPVVINLSSLLNSAHAAKIFE